MKNEKSNEHKDLFSSVLNINKFTNIKHKYNTDITKQTGSFIFMTYLREIINQEVNIHLNRKYD